MLTDVSIRHVKESAFDFVDRNKEEIARISDAIFYFAELGMQEFRTSEYTADALRKAGFEVETGISGMPPAWIATWGSGKPVVAVHTEGDALPSQSQRSGVMEKEPIVAGAPGHVEGHNTNMAVMIGGGVAAKAVMEREGIDGTIKLYFGPAEEQLISRPYILRDGFYDGVDAIFHTHVDRSLATKYGLYNYANIIAEFIFHGKSAASASPFTARNAKDALILMDVGWGLMRQQLEPSQRSSGVVVSGGEGPGVIPDQTKAKWSFKDKSLELAKRNFEIAKRIAAGAATMTGCTCETNIVTICWPTRSNRLLAETIQKNMEMIGMPHWSSEDEQFARELQRRIKAPEVGLPKEITPLSTPKEQHPSSNDLGCVSWVIPQGRIGFPANIPGTINHQWTAGVALTTPIAHKGTTTGAKVLAGSMLDLFLEPALVDKIKKNFQEEIGDIKYVDVLPKDREPPADLNRDEMEKWRPSMEPHYRKDRVEWK